MEIVNKTIHQQCYLDKRCVCRCVCVGVCVGGREEVVTAYQCDKPILRFTAKGWDGWGQFIFLYLDYLGLVFGHAIFCKIRIHSIASCVSFI